MGVFQCDVFQNNVFQGPCDVVVEAPSGGAFYPTPEEIRALRKRIRDKDEAERAKAAKLDAAIRDAHDEVSGVKAARAQAKALEAIEAAALKAEMDELVEFIQFVKFTRTLH